MILYKYVDFDTGLKIIQNRTLAFTSCTFLNDPFETTAGAHSEESNSVFSSFNRVFGIAANYQILSLTRNPLNAIMWSHYAKAHNGFVIGIDAHKAGLLNEQTCVLPAKYGGIIYTTSKPSNTYYASTDSMLFEGALYLSIRMKVTT